MSIPHLFRCPISLDLFTDPVTLCTGQTYDRPSIERWLADGNLTCPVTMQRLRDPSLVPNHTLRHLVDQWLLTDPDGPSPHDPPAIPPVADAAFSLPTLAHILRSPAASVDTKLETLRKIRTLSLESDVGQSCLIQLGFFPLLLQVLFLHPSSSHDQDLVELALDCVLSLSPSTHSSSLDVLMEAPSLASLVALLEDGSTKIKTSLCYLLEAITASPRSEELCLVVGQTPRVLRALLSLLGDLSSATASDAAARAISGLCSLEPNRVGAVGEGAVDALVAYLARSDRRGAARAALATMEQLAGTDGVGGGALLGNPNAVRVLVKMVFRVSDDGVGCEHAVGALLAVCRSSGRARAEAVTAGALTQLLLLLQSQCGSKAKNKARALLKLLSSVCVHDHDPTMGTSLP
uniref:U-box domain-containing protein n=1 Tax=Anthurium amnicola TaxID=1678845 RepID=A0A1D1XEJ9_9ARAE